MKINGQIQLTLKFKSCILIFVATEVYPSLAEGIGLENRQAGQTARGFESLYLLHSNKRINIGDMETTTEHVVVFFDR